MRFADFYPFYLSQHSDRTCRRLHFVGTSLGLAALLHALATLEFRWLLAGLAVATMSERPDRPQRVTRLETDFKSADAKFPGTPLWRRTEPDNDPALSALLADDITQWVRACAG